MHQHEQRTINLNQIRLNADGFINCRSSIGDITELAKSIRETGLNDPPLVWEQAEGDYILVDGYRRFAAIDALREEDASAFEQLVVTVLPVDLVGALAKNLAANIQRADLNPADKIDAVARLYTSLPDQTAVADHLGMSQPWVSTMLKIKKCVIPAALVALRQDKVSLTFIKSLSKVTDEEGNPHVEVQQRLLDKEMGEEVKDPTPKAKTKRTSAEIADLKAAIYEMAETSTQFDRVYMGGVIATLDWLSCKIPLELLLDPDSGAADVSSQMDDDERTVGR